MAADVGCATGRLIGHAPEDMSTQKLPIDAVSRMQGGEDIPLDWAGG